MKICYVAPASIHATRWAAFFASRGHDVHFVLVGAGPDLPAKPVVLHDLRSPAGVVSQTFKVARQLRSLLRQIAPDVVHAHSIGVPGLAAALAGHQRLVLTAWGSDVVLAKPWTVRRAAVKRALRRAVLITCDAEHMRQRIVGLGGPEAQTEVVYFGTDTTVFRPDAKADVALPGVFSGTGPVVFSLRSFRPVYDVQTLIRAAPVVLDAVPEARIVLAGDGPLRPMLEELSRFLGVERGVDFVGPLTQPQVMGALNASDVYVSTSLSDGGLASSTSEAMACGRSVVVTDAADNRDWINDDVNGRLFPCSDHSVLAARLIHLLRSPKERERLGQEARRTIVARNDYHTEMARMESMYRALL